jgi:hypothetical protein
MFMVDNEEWKAAVEVDRREEILCKPCFLEIQRLIGRPRVTMRDLDMQPRRNTAVVPK